jgi:hypothetical protein
MIALAGTAADTEQKDEHTFCQYSSPPCCAFAPLLSLLLFVSVFKRSVLPVRWHRAGTFVPITIRISFCVLDLYALYHKGRDDQLGASGVIQALIFVYKTFLIIFGTQNCVVKPYIFVLMFTNTNVL